MCIITDAKVFLLRSRSTFFRSTVARGAPAPPVDNLAIHVSPEASSLWFNNHMKDEFLVDAVVEGWGRFHTLRLYWLKREMIYGFQNRYIFNKLEDEDVTWLPLRTCRVMEQFDAKNESKGEWGVPCLSFFVEWHLALNRSALVFWSFFQRRVRR